MQTINDEHYVYSTLDFENNFFIIALTSNNVGHIKTEPFEI